MLMVFLDTETTGLNPFKHRTIEIALKVVESKKVLTSYESVVAQPFEVLAEADPRSLQVNGFTQEQILHGKSEKVVATEIENELNHVGFGEKESVFVCQNPSFDRAFFNQLISVEQQQAHSWPYHWLDLASMFWALNSNITEERSLSKNAIAQSMGIPTEPDPHRAMNGVTHLMSCYEALFAQSRSHA